MTDDYGSLSDEVGRFLDSANLSSGLDSERGIESVIVATGKLARIISEFYNSLAEAKLPDELVGSMTAMFMANLISMGNAANAQEEEEG